MPAFRESVETAGLVIDATGVAVIVVGLLWAAARFASGLGKGTATYRQLRVDIGRGILLGLELLVAADIVRTVAVRPTLDGVLVLGVIVLIRTFLSMSLEVELQGRWPWQEGRDAKQGP